MEPIPPSNLSPVGTHTQSCWPHCSSCPPAPGYSCKAKNLLWTAQESCHLTHALPTALPPTSASKRIFEQKKDLYQATVLYIFFREILVKKGFPGPSWIRKSSWIVSIPAARHLLGVGENRDGHLALPHPKWLPESPGYYLYWHGCPLWVLCTKH